MWRWLARISTTIALGLWGVILIAGAAVVLYGLWLLYQFGA